ncbi:hypothetical protein EWM64_g1679 [Hericium alpestre]|uniref:Uncharacterized protein n=1 Tax=Hericium alpestre TaxID=135208 RepID=A0A4Z0A9X2_9AGAM|nr:hypothetical protein EWM64_g1679 [Hericium alpestre]
MRVHRLPLFIQILLLGALCSTARAFSFSTSDPTECGALTLTWRSAAIWSDDNPHDSFQNGKGSFTVALPLTSGQKFVVMMSDKTGPAAGGISNLLQVGGSTGASCSTRLNPIKFSFDLPLALKQCGNYQFTGFTETGATPPVQVIVAVPGGTAEFLTIPKGQKTYDWVANLAAGTSVLFSMSDSTGGLGGSSDLLPVGDSDTKNCLDSFSPSSTAQPSPSSTSPTGSSTTSAGGGSTTTESSHSISGRVVAAIVATSLVVCVAVIGGAVFFVWRRRHHSPSMKAEMIDLADDPAAATSLLYHPMYQPDPFTSAPSSANLPLTPPPPSGSEYNRSEHESSVGSSGPGAAGPLPVKGVPNPHRPTTYVQHTDVYDLPVGDDGVVELPPQYSESRAAISGIPNLMNTPGARPSGSSQHSPSPAHS